MIAAHFLNSKMYRHSTIIENLKTNDMNDINIITHAKPDLSVPCPGGFVFKYINIDGKSNLNIDTNVN